MIRQAIKQGCQNISDKQDAMCLAAYLQWIQEQEGVGPEEAMQIFHEDPAARIGWKMQQYGISRLATKKGREKFRQTLDPDELPVWDSPERPDNIAKMIAGATKETVKKIRHR